MYYWFWRWAGCWQARNQWERTCHIFAGIWTILSYLFKEIPLSIWCETTWGIIDGIRPKSVSSEELRTMFNFISGSSSASFTSTSSGFVFETTKWWNFFMDVMRLYEGARKPVKSWVGTMISSLSWPINWAELTVTDCSTTFTMSLRQPTSVLQKRCFMSPKHQSGENFVCPAGKKDKVIDWFKPTLTLQIMYWSWDNMLTQQ